MGEEARSTGPRRVHTAGGIEVDTQRGCLLLRLRRGFGRARGGGNGGLAAGVRIGLHTGTPHPTSEGYVGPTCTGRHGSPRPGTAGRSLSRLPPRTSGTPARSRPLGAAPPEGLPSPSCSTSSGRTRSRPQDDREHEPPHPALELPGTRGGSSRGGPPLQETRLLSVTGPGEPARRASRSSSPGRRARSASRTTRTASSPAFSPRFATRARPGDDRADALGARGAGQSALETLAAQLGWKRMLLVLDNAEHLLPAVAEDLSQLLTVARR